ncbi:MAG: hypothetical protein JWM34_1787 [Ilumatobacteraceae bacterium]|nr:hypothetical protein [Ilumatobacteraceae bacterium]
MSIAVDLADLPRAIAGQIGWAYLLTMSEADQARVLAVVPGEEPDGTLTFEVGKGTAANVAEHPAVTLVYPPSTATAMSLIVDGTTSIDGRRVIFTPTWAVMHRSALPEADE